jgi:alpha-beta hydrolase superfamily lysophospholipase
MERKDFAWRTGDGLDIQASEWKPDGAAKAVVALVHGLGEHCQRYDHMARAFGAAGVGVVAFDLPGHGRSGGPRGHSSYAVVTEQIDHLLDEAKARFPGLPVFLYGHSLGGSLALNYLVVRKPPIKGAIVTSPGLATAKPLPALKLLLAKLMAGIAPSFTLPNDLELAGLSRDPEVVRLYQADPLVHDRVSARLGLDLIEAGPRLIERAKEITLPLLLLQGSADRLVSPEATDRFAKAAGSNVEYRSYEGGYHELHNEPEKEALFASVLAWMAARK